MASSLEGVAKLSKQLAELGQVVQGKGLRETVRTAIKPARDKAKALIPVGVDAHQTHKGRLVAPGFAKRSIAVAVKLGRTGQSARASLGVRPEAFYAVNFVELGTAKMSAHPWLRPAFESTRAQQESAVADGLRKVIEKAARKR